MKDVDDTGEDIPELTLTGSLVAGASVGAFGSSRSCGRHLCDVDFNLNDPDGDGRVRYKELLANARMDPRCIFDIHGKITAGSSPYGDPFVR